ncbi:molybdenum ABC transporter ATP-binding protein [Sessilibacter corallicola]|uniref:molybdenum ABC transporter ATP-binding protein n=1 Tax=Sessilibacter corallicola TaxID=2904075 RepID=UPI001E3BB705|nr:molybdenum ABC transporter ATP-binding protein [Sessilibacter corallicola]MCE2027184.1 molybdenum ABC transporter ATP-binding protein [Sessilibacter corallicola]
MTEITVHYQVNRPEFHLNVKFTANGTGVTALFGQSGSGKTTLLRCIAGLEQADEGIFIFNGEPWQNTDINLPAHKRPIGYVFQEANLFPHLSVEKNLQYGFKRRKASEKSIGYDDAIHLVGINSLLKRLPSQLSGGQRQRVAIARALLTNPQLLLMDEPLASLDIQSKAEILPYLEQLNQQLDIPVFYVSHSPDEVLRIADDIVLLKDGHVEATGHLNDVLTRTDLPLAKLEEASAAVTGVVSKHNEEFHLTYVKIQGGTVAVSKLNLPIGHKARIRISAKDVSLALTPAQNTSITNAFPVKIASITPTVDPAKVLIKLDMGGDYFLSQITKLSAHQLELTVGKIVYAQIKSVALMR